MAQYRDLNAPPSRVLADIVADMKAEARQSKTGAAGVKDLGLLVTSCGPVPVVARRRCGTWTST